uniref:Major facilitator superfamily domain containing 3 n=1 Tax=Sphenodon punctatus TaxID=8508 RepID=A0A8D0HLQ8_SPHPU
MNPRYVLLGLLYFVQGMPYGLQSSLLPIYFRSVGLSFTRIGLAKVLYLPWILKVLWAPLVDQYLTKRSWLLLSMSGLLAACLAGASLTPEIHFLPVAAMLLLMNLLASVQDIAVDGVAVQLLGQEEVGHGNTIQVVAYKMGSVVAGGGFLTLMNRLGWGCLFVFLAAIYLLAILYAWGAPELRGTRPSTSQESCARTRTLNLWWILRELLSVPDTPWTIGFVLLYKLGEFSGAMSVSPHALPPTPQQLGHQEGALMKNTCSRGACLRLSLREALLPPNPSCPVSLAAAAVLSLSVQHFVGGMITTLTFSLMMHCTQRADSSIQATHYSFLAALEVLGKLAFSTLVGGLVDWLGFGASFCIFLLLSLASVLYVRWAPPARR